MEYYGYDIFTVEGNPFNIKITLEQDIKYAEYIIDFLKKSN
jgi:2-C-methyl-D-erythritol 4-phosphate cytidylyltransferase